MRIYYLSYCLLANNKISNIFSLYITYLIVCWLTGRLYYNPIEYIESYIHHKCSEIWHVYSRCSKRDFI